MLEKDFVILMYGVDINTPVILSFDELKHKIDKKVAHDND